MFLQGRGGGPGATPTSASSTDHTQLTGRWNYTRVPYFVYNTERVLTCLTNAVSHRRKNDVKRTIFNSFL